MENNVDKKEICQWGRGISGNPPSPLEAMPNKLWKRGITMNYQVQENYLTIFLPSELDHHNAEEIRRESDRLIERNHIRYVIFDFRDTNFMDSSGIGVIMGRYKRVYLLGGEVFAVHTSERMKRILSMSGVTKIMQICEEDM